MASSLVYLGISVIVFIISFGLIFQVGATVLGSVYTITDQTFDSMGITGVWATMFGDIQSISVYLLPLMMSLGIVLLVLKVLMASGVLGRD